jgi:putative transposase
MLEDNGRYAAIDLGMNNLCAVANNVGLDYFVINGRIPKSINQWRNKKTACLQSGIHPDAKGRQRASKAIRKQNINRDNRLDDYMHKASKYIVEWAVKNNICSIVIGENKGWKQEAEMGKRNNQNFQHIPFTKLKNKIAYKARMEGISVAFNEESYTSKCSAVDNEPVKKHETYLGRRVKRGLFRSAEGYRINADINGAHNIGRKYFGNIWIFQKEWVDLPVHKIRSFR